MIIIKEIKPSDFFQDRLAVLHVVGEYINLDFDVPYKKFKAGDRISKQYFYESEITYLKKELKITKLPYEIYNEDKLNQVYDLVRK